MTATKVSLFLIKAQPCPTVKVLVKSSPQHKSPCPQNKKNTNILIKIQSHAQL